MSDVPPADQPEAPAPTTVGARPRSLWLFGAVILVFLAGDLWLKAWSFEQVAGVPLRVSAGSDGPVVEVPAETALVGRDGRVLALDGAQGRDDGWVVVPRRAEDEPASAVPWHEPTPLVPGVLELELTLNTGAVFGMGQGARGLFVVVSVLAVGVILVLVWRSPANARLYHIGLGMVLSGALGNLYDRVRFAAVRDMLHMLPETGLWPWIFNVADVALVVGVCLLLLFSFLDGRAQAQTDRG